MTAQVGVAFVFAFLAGALAFSAAVDAIWDKARSARVSLLLAVLAVVYACWVMQP